MNRIFCLVSVLMLVLLAACSEPFPQTYQPLPKAVNIEPFKLHNQDGAEIASQALKDKWTLLFFGYTFCPDVCPTTLAEMNQVAAKTKNENLQVVLLSVDPERDTVEQLKNYITYFNPKFQAWSGEPAQIESLARQMHVFFQKQPFGESYLMDHSSQVVLLNPQGQYQGFFTSPLSTDDMVRFLDEQM